MAYAAVISLKQTIHELLNSSLVSSNREIFEFAYNQTTSLQKVLEGFNDGSGSCSERLNTLEGEIRDAAHQLEDVLEFHEVTQSYSLQEVSHEISSFAEAAKKMEVEYVQEVSKPVIAAVASATDFGVEMVGRSTELNFIRRCLLRRIWPDDMCFIAVLGHAGSGRTLVAKAFYEAEFMGEEHLFDRRTWVTVGSNYNIEALLMRILAQLDSLAGHCEMLARDKICSCLNKTLKSQRCFIMLDDVRDEELVQCLRSSCPYPNNGGLVVFTTSSKRVSKLAESLQTMNLPKCNFEKYMWAFIYTMIFDGDQSMSPEIVEYAKRIIENAAGDAISTVKILLFLHKTKKLPEQWSKIAADKEDPIFMVGDEITELHKIKRELQYMDAEKDEKGIGGVISTFLDSFEYCSKLGELPKRFFRKMQIVSLFGMVGIGKSTCARKVFKDRSIVCHFDHRVWITLGPNYQPEEILVDILAQIFPSIDKMLMKENEELARGLCAQLAHKRCLIVLDDLWSKEPLGCLNVSFPDIRGTALVTTRLAKVAKFGNNDTCYEMKLLDKEKSWCLLREKIFTQGLCPPELEKAGLEIANKCEGLPLLILTVAEQLLKVEISVEYWNKVALGKEKTVFRNAHHDISKALLPSYERLPQHLKACFLYIGVFFNDYEIPASKITNLWIVERFLDVNSLRPLKHITAEYLADLVDDSLVMAKRTISRIQIKTCRLHPVFWHLSSTVALKNKLFYGMNCYDDCSIESMKNQRRLCIRNSVLLGIKDVSNAMEFSSKSRSLLCSCPPHRYPVPLYFGSRLLRVLDAVAIRFYQFPFEVVELINLRYLGLTCNGELPTSISKLWKLQHLIVNRYINTRSLDNCFLLPGEIWDMKELKHLQVMGGLLPNPKCGVGLPNLTTLLDVSAQCCRKKVLKRIPNLKRLGIQIELAPQEKRNPFNCLNRISRLRRLESLKCVVMNPHIGFNVVAPPSPISMFPSSLEELSLSGFGYPWKYMSIIGKLKRLKVLKSKRYAFRGPKWDMVGRKLCDSAFCKLECLSIEDTDLVRWEDNMGNFKKLKCLSIKHCYKIQELPKFLNFPFFRNLEIVDCSPLTVSWAEKAKEMVTKECEINVHLSWIDESRKE